VRYNVVACGRRSDAVIFSPTELDRGIEVVTGNSTRAPDFHDRCRLRDASALSWTSKKCLNIEKASPPPPCSGGETGAAGEAINEISKTGLATSRYAGLHT
jgi:hypothetical protein